MSANQTMMSSEPNVKHRRETILVVEDGEPLLKLLRFFLADAGYTVLHAKDGEGAVSTYWTHLGDIDLVLTDLGLPGVRGKEEILKLGRINPDVRILCASGRLDPGLETEMVQPGSRGCIQMPCAPEEILRTVRDVLTSGTPHSRETAHWSVS
jgi:two-component system cell cycle sensor histidine kinase/response regulator CckA